MTKRPITTHPDTPIDDALKLMRESKVRRLPVLDKKGELVGIVTEKDLLYVSPSPATSLSIHELHYLIAKIKVGDVMAKDVITVTEYTPLEEAARIMADNKIGSLPVMRDGKLVGIITETDIFKGFVELLGTREPGVRLTVKMPEGQGVLPLCMESISKLGGSLLALITWAGHDPGTRIVTAKVTGVDTEQLKESIARLGVEVVDFRVV